MTGAGPPAPIIVTAVFGGEDAAYLNRLRTEHFPPERNQLDPHLTLFHHLAPDLARELKQRLAAETRGIAAPDARIAGVISLGRGTAFRIESPALEDIRARLAEAFAPMLVPQDLAGWRPHVTIQNKVEAAVARALRQQMEADFAPRRLAIAGLAAWWYRGGPWEALSRHMFA
ncbi:2'-5' RNA ligase family protein [Sphingomonas qomolangmaensis]|uniref:2'-5' RNA ligase family protein n=1 Tax=Sphingomonas qomolangmaensis TaxID=2918765 RepID=A0ABY5L8C4_9SPHN|nr:2'-5' RNA ligase family protein [Sphingomonas qomolangmaensis]UUL83225.1 2'-5' RNA ligase family protein [Sphingomonas qomolangmaensis]